MRSHSTPDSERKGQTASPSARPRALSDLWQPKLADMTTSHDYSLGQHLWYTGHGL